MPAHPSAFCYERETRGQILVSVAQHLHVFLLCIKHQRAMSVLDLDLANGAEVAWQNSRCKQFQLLCYPVRSLLVGILTSLLLATCIIRVNAVLIAAVNLVCQLEGGGDTDAECDASTCIAREVLLPCQITTRLGK